jgi:hypothetical protein
MKSKAMTVLNVGVVFTMIVFAIVTHTEMANIRPHTKIDKSFVAGVLESGDQLLMEDSLKATEVARAVGFEGRLQAMNILTILCIITSMVAVANLFLLEHSGRWKNRKRVPVRVIDVELVTSKG